MEAILRLLTSRQVICHEKVLMRDEEKNSPFCSMRVYFSLFFSLFFGSVLLRQSLLKYLLLSLLLF